MKNTLVIKLGGALLNSDVSMIRFFSVLHSYYHRFRGNILIVHGGNFWINTEIKKMNDLMYKDSSLHYIQNNNYVNFKINMLSGTINNYIVKWAKEYQINSIGLCLTYENNIIFKKNKSNIFPSLHSLKLIKYLFSRNIIPIISPAGITKNNLFVDIPSDIVAMSLSIILKARLIFLTDVSSILNGKGKCIKKITHFETNKLIHEGIITNGMIEKLNAAIRVSYYLKQSVNISGWHSLNQLKLLLQGDTIGTHVSFV
ncbi:Acetylglutamate kinase [Buchnera aphidicola (Phyllaphis fagi)]|uniref:amino acid kinase family protein n=1 Tax=Buchnera aphidicola TaxID=9 RepID=UPI003464256C